jgi:excisionase family DNA binding protein
MRREKRQTVKAPELLTVREAAEYLRISEQMVYRLIEAGTLPASKLFPNRKKARYRLLKSDVDALLKRGG